jgi:hypothetical protein
MMSRKYWTLIVWRGGAWHPEFGDYSRVTVAEEWKDSYRDEKCRMILSDDSQAAIDAEVAKQEPLE